MWYFIWVIVCAGFVVTIGLWIAHVNGRFKSRKTVVDHAREVLEAQLKRRHEAIERLLASIAQKESIDANSSENVAFLTRRAKNVIQLSEMEHFESSLAETLRDFLATSDNSPLLANDEGYTQARERMNEVEHDLMKADQFYNDAVRQFNEVIDFAPNRLVAALFSFSRQDYFEVKSALPDSRLESSPAAKHISGPKRSRRIQTSSGRGN
jgi:LemA protein